ncbi:hypothetical protein Misp01_38970 [Microtetraspora sp. NBRC 13810]|uniref:NADH-quinone oxidoreductase subunit N n=1 Tax=Microtetraspora sp. NBRC 13810 TaxID=3030990 RepID=UPI0025575A66|nr:NADH-quinone oxidoreductase subunit N [Microtetraspora sp. NBRC 13810]GLW08767.1 hypothetical protein Misp01_38970 [Microtetraspora sp. NBRC 13810]
MIQSIDYVAIAPLLILAATAALVLLLDAFLPPTSRPAPTATRPDPVPTRPDPASGARPAPAATTRLESAVGARRESAAGSRPESAAGGRSEAAATTRPASVSGGRGGAVGGAADETGGGAEGGGRGRGVLGLVTLAGVLGALAAVVFQAATGAGRRTFCVPSGLVSGEPPCSFVADPFALVIAGLVLVAAVVVVLLSMTELAEGRIPVGEWYFLTLCALVGAVALPASRDLVMLVVALELVSLPVFALTALKRYDGRASEAALKLFLVSVVSTAVMLFGVSLLYGLTGTVYLDRLTVNGAPAPVMAVAVMLVLAGFGFKVAAVPFHSWAADVYEGAPVPVAALLSVISKAAGFAGLILLLVVALGEQSALWSTPVAVLAALTMTAGNLLALRQRHAVRLLAWSSVAQSGYILAPLGIGGATLGGAADASVAYLVFYAAMNLGAFAVVMLVSRRSERNELDDYRGLAFRNPAAAVALGFCLVCLAGLPPGLAGLFAKVVVFRELVDGGGLALAVVMAVNTVIGLYYYVAWTARLFTPAPRESEATPAPAESAARLAPNVTQAADVAPGVTEGAGVAPGVVERTGLAERATEGAGVAPGVAEGAGVASGVTEGAGVAAGDGGALGVGAEVGVESGGRSGRLVPVVVAIGLAVLVAVAFSVFPQLVFDLLAGGLSASG